MQLPSQHQNPSCKTPNNSSPCHRFGPSMCLCLVCWLLKIKISIVCLVWDDMSGWIFGGKHLSSSKSSTRTCCCSCSSRFWMAPELEVAPWYTAFHLDQTSGACPVQPSVAYFPCTLVELRYLLMCCIFFNSFLAISRSVFCLPTFSFRWAVSSA